MLQEGLGLSSFPRIEKGTGCHMIPPKVTYARLVAWVASDASETPLYMYTILQQNCGTSLLHEQSYIAEVLGVKMCSRLVKVIEYL